jgi:hypothetical protein
MPWVCDINKAGKVAWPVQQGHMGAARLCPVVHQLAAGAPLPAPRKMLSL